MAFVGSWKLTFSDGGAGAVAKASGTPDDVIMANKDFGDVNCNVIEKITYDGSSISTEISVNGKVLRNVTLPVGKETEAPGLDGRVGKHTVTITGDTISRKQVIDGKEVSYVRTVSGNEMTVQVTGPAGTKGTRKYAKQ